MHCDVIPHRATLCALLQQAILFEDDTMGVTLPKMSCIDLVESL